MSTATPKAGNTGKDVVYIDVDDEITGIIDKVRESGQKIVALVLPKRAAVLQSIVNMKLLKRAAEEAQKNVVLITSEAGLLPLAGNVGMHVAKTLQTKPEIPDSPGRADDLAADTIQESDDVAETSDVPIDKARSIGELAAGTMTEDDLDDTIEMDDEEPLDDDTSVDSTVTPKPAKNKKLHIPNFNRFRLLMLLGIPVIILLGIGLYVCLAILPKAAITIKTDSQAFNSSAVLTLKTGSGVTLDVASATLPATQQSVQKTLSQQVDATGQQNNGAKATGTVKFFNCNQDDVITNTNHTIPAGTGISISGLTFITSADAIVPPSHYTKAIGGTCKQDLSSNTVGITAQKGGTNYNQAGGTYAVPGYTTITGSGGATTGGTDDITKIVTQADIDSATQKIGSQDTSTVKQELHTALTTKNVLPIDETLNAGSPQTKTSVNAGDAAANVTVTQTITYTMLGVSQDDLQKIVAKDVDKKIDIKRQTILDYGLTSAVFGLQAQNPDGASVTFQTTAVAGSVINVSEIKTQIAGKKGGDAGSLIKQNPGVTDVTVTYSPFWVSSIPSNTSKITVTVEKPKVSRNASTNP